MTTAHLTSQGLHPRSHAGVARYTGALTLTPESFVPISFLSQVNASALMIYVAEVAR